MGVFAKVGFVVFGALLLAASAGAQCETTDADMNGVPDVCPAGSNYVEGSPGGDLLFGTGGADCIFGFGGTDFIFAFGGDDYICAGDGSDLVFGAGGTDSIFGEGGDDIISGGGGADVINGGEGDDDLFGGGGGDSISGGPGNDDLDGGGGDDALSGGEGEDNLDGGGGTNDCVEEVPGTSERLDNCAAITFASVLRFDVLRARRGGVVTWETTTEVGVVSFRLWRIDDRDRLSFVGEVPAAQDGRVHGGTYFLRDDDAESTETRYLLEERTVSGAGIKHGPFARTPRSLPEADVVLAEHARFRRVPRTVAFRRWTDPIPRPTQRFRKSAGEGVLADAVVVVAEEGLIEVSADALAEAMGAPAPTVQSSIADGMIRLTLGGRSIAWEALDGFGGIRFFAASPASPFAATDRYLVSIAEGTTMASGTLEAGSEGAAHTYLETARFEEDTFPGITGNPNPREDLFFWHALTGPAEVSIPLTLDAVANGSAQTLRVSLHGATVHEEQPFDVELRWDGESLGRFTFEGRHAHQLEVNVDAFDVGDEVELTVVQHQEGPDLPVLYLDAIEVDYRRTAHAGSPFTRFSTGPVPSQVVTGIPADTVRVYDITERHAPVSFGEVALVEAEDAYALRFGAAPDRKFLAVTADGVSAPAAVYGRFPSTLQSISHDATYVIVAASHLVQDAEALADLRRADGYRVLVVDVEDVYWEFAGGVTDPAAVRSFLTHAYRTWTERPRFAVLLGEGTFDYRNIMGAGGNAVPPMLAQTEGGLFPADSMLGDVEGDDGVPEIAVGRLPVLDSAEFEQTLEAIRQFEATRDLGAILATSDAIKGADFRAASSILRGRMPFDRTHALDLDEIGVEDARAELFLRWQSPVSWVSFVGHGGVDRLSDLGLLVTEDLDGLAPESAPVFLGFTCNIGRFDIPGYRGLGQELVSRGLSAGVFAATGWSNHPRTDALRTALVGAAFASTAETLGDAVLAAHQAAASAPLEVHRVYGLLGDPALRIRDKQAPSNPPGDEPPSEPDVPRDRPLEPTSASAASGCTIGATEQRSGPTAWLVLLVAFALRSRRKTRVSRIH